MTFELNDHKYEFSEEPLPDVRLEGVDAVIKGLNSVKWHCNVGRFVVAIVVEAMIADVCVM